MGSLNSFVSLPEGINISDSLIQWLIFNTLIYLSLVTIISILVSLLLSLHDHHFFSIGEKQLEPILSISMLAALMVDSHPSRYLPADFFEDICQETTSGCKMFDGSLMKRLCDSKWSIFGFFLATFFSFYGGRWENSTRVMLASGHGVKSIPFPGHTTYPQTKPGRIW